MNAIEFPSMELALGDGQRLVIGRVSSIRPTDGEPLTFIPGVDGEESSNTYAGNSVYWSGAFVVLDVDGEPLELPLKLAIGGADVLDAIGRPVAEDDLLTMVGACAVAVVGGDYEAAIVGGSRVVAAASGAGQPPIAFDNQFRSLASAAPSLAAFARGGGQPGG